MKSYLRFISKNKLYTAIEVAGLSVSLAFVLLLGSYIFGQISITRCIPDSDRVYTIEIGQISSFYGLRDVMKEEFPEVETAANISEAGNQIYYSFENELYEGTYTIMDREMYSLFPIRFIEGSDASAEIGTEIIVSQSFAKRHSDNIIGKAIKINNNTYTVGAIVEDFKGSLLPYTDIIFNYNDSGIARNFENSPFGNIGPTQTFIKVKEGSDIAGLEAKANAWIDSKKTEYSLFSYNALQNGLKIVPFKDIYFHEDSYYLEHGDISIVKALSFITLLILICAVINYVNLCFALSSKRAKEMATRKLAGADKGIFVRYIAESTALTMLCYLISIGLAIGFTPAVNGLLEHTDTTARISISASHAIVTGFIALAVGIICGIFPALQSRQYKPIDVVNGNFRRRSKMIFSKIFITMQTTFAVIMLTISLIMELQMKHMMDYPLGIETGNICLLQDSGVWYPYETMSDLTSRLEQLPCVTSYGFANAVPGMAGDNWTGKDKNGEEVMIRRLLMDKEAFEALGFRIVAEFNTNDENGVWISEKTAAMLGFDPENLSFDYYCNTGNERYQGRNITGIVGDFACGDASWMNEEEYPCIFIVKPETLLYGYLVVKLAGDKDEAERQVLHAFDEYWTNEYGNHIAIPDDAWTGSYEDIRIKEMAIERNTMRLMELFMSISIFISLIGLIAMSSYFAAEREKDIALRKVYGGTVASETSRNLRDYLFMTLAACIIGIPVAIWLGDMYLEEFPYRIHLGLPVALIAASAAFIISLAAVLWQTLRAARTNPAEALKKE